MNEIYKETAKEFGVTDSEIRNEIEKAISEAYKNPNEYAKRVPCKGRQPDFEELAEFIISEIVKKHGN
ncbi:MAG: hypothetical protein J6L05_05760 [Ruminococcus sp.]|nr:hypothetical protein [Ruminococcus sp.]